MAHEIISPLVNVINTTDHIRDIIVSCAKISEDRYTNTEEHHEQYHCIIMNQTNVEWVTKHIPQYLRASLSKLDEIPKIMLSLDDTRTYALYDTIGTRSEIFKKNTSTVQFSVIHCDIGALVSNIVSDFCASNNNSCVPSLEIANNRSCNVNPLLLRFVLFNLLTNAQKHAGQNAKISVIVNHRNISVIDNGIGITKKNISKIFDLFFSTNQYNKGYGVGLALCKILMLQMNGNIKVKSTIGKGTEFIITLPT